jgi:hypothetical protein
MDEEALDFYDDIEAREEELAQEALHEDEEDEEENFEW